MFNYKPKESLKETPQKRGSPGWKWKAANPWFSNFYKAGTGQ